VKLYFPEGEIDFVVSGALTTNRLPAELAVQVRLRQAVLLH